MMRGDPSSTLRHDVRSRIERRPSRRNKPMWIPALAGVMTLVVVAVVSQRNARDAVLTSRARGVAISQTIAPAETNTPEPRQVVRIEPERPNVVNANVSNVLNGPTDPDEPIFDPLVIAPIAVPVIAVDTSSGVMPIEIEPLQIEPLQPQ
jgi:hypothetical protein